MPSSAFITCWISATSCSPDMVVGSTGGWSRWRSRTTRSRSVSGGSAPEVTQGRQLRQDVIAGAAHEQPQERLAADLVEPTGDAEVEQRRASVGLDEQVPPVKVAVEDPLEDGPLERGDHAGADHRLGVDPGAAHADHVVEAEAVEPLHHQHATGDQFGVGPGHDVAPLAELGEGASQVHHVLGLQPEVELLGDRLGEQLDQRRRVGQRGDRNAPHQFGRQPRHDPQVVAHQPGDRRPLDLDHHPLAGPQGGGVDLGDRGGGQRAAVDPAERLVQREAQILLDDLAHDAERFGRDLVAAELELVHQLGGEDALARGDDLPQLDVRRSQAFRGHAQAAGDAGPADLRHARPLLPQHPQRQGRAQPAGDGEHATPRRPPPRAGEPGHLGHHPSPHVGEVAPPGESRRVVERPRRAVTEAAGVEIRGDDHRGESRRRPPGWHLKAARARRRPEPPSARSRRACSTS